MDDVRSTQPVKKKILYAALSTALLGATATWAVTNSEKSIVGMDEEPVMCITPVNKDDRSMQEITAMNDDHAMHAMSGDHAMHQAMAKKQKYTLKRVDYPILDVTLKDSSGKKMSLSKVLDQGQPVALNFIFTTCTTICPVMTATFKQMRRELGEASSRELRMVSISIDPEYDRPDVLKAYAKKFGADSDWLFLTGNAQDIVNVLRSFDVYAGSKANHMPVTLLRDGHGGKWTRVDGIASGRELARLAQERILN